MQLQYVWDFVVVGMFGVVVEELVVVECWMFFVQMGDGCCEFDQWQVCCFLVDLGDFVVLCIVVVVVVLCVFEFIVVGEYWYVLGQQEGGQEVVLLLCLLLVDFDVVGWFFCVQVVGVVVGFVVVVVFVVGFVVFFVV